MSSERADIHLPLAWSRVLCYTNTPKRRAKHLGVLCTYVSKYCTQTRNIYHYWKWQSHFQYWHPLPTVLFWIPLQEISQLVHGTQTGNLPLLVLGVTHFVPFPVLGYAVSGTVIHWAPYRNWALCVWSHFRYGALPVPVLSFTGPHTETGLYVRGPISGTGLCQFRYGHSLGPVPILDSMCGGYARLWVCGSMATA